jgi:uncharacterized membrane protein YccC
MIASVGAVDPFVFKSALRAAIVMPLAFALALLVIDSKQMSLFAAFGSMALLVFVDFGGARRARLRAYLFLLAAGVALIVLGTLCSRSVWLATIAMALVAFVVLFAGVLDDHIAAARGAAMLTFALPVMVPADPAAIWTRLAGWGLAGALCIPATLLLWPGRPRSALRRGAAQVARSLAELVEARSQGDRAAGEEAARTAHTETVALRDRFVSMAQRPSGTAGPTAALGRLIEDLGWLHRVADRVPALAGAATTCPAERAGIVASAPGALRGMAARLEGLPADAALDLKLLGQAHEAFGRAQLAYFEGVQPDHDEAEATVELDEAYRLRELSYGTLLAGRDALLACGESPDVASGQASERTSHPRIDAARRLLRAHASLNSVWLRNSLRGALGLALAVLVAQVTDLQHAFWVVLGTLSVLRSSALATSATIAWALLGTLAGIVVGGLIIIAVGGDPAALWAVLPFAVLLAAYAPQAISFAAGQAAFTLVVLVLFNLIEPGGWRVGLVRVEDIAIGAAVSLLVGVLAWPRGTTAILRRAIGSAYLGAAHQLDATIAALLGEGEQAQASLAAREAFDTAQLLDAAVRDYIATRTSVRGRLHDLTVLTTGASRLRRVARLLQDTNVLIRLTPVGDDMPRLARARDAFDLERHARCDWYESLGTAISQAVPPPEPEPGRERTGEDMDGPIRTVVLEQMTAGGKLHPGLAIAWAHRHLDVLTDVEPMLTSAYARISDGAGRGSPAADPNR